MKRWRPDLPKPGNSQTNSGPHNFGCLRGTGSHRGWLVAGGLLTVALAVGLLWLLLRTLPEAVDPTWDRIQETGVLRVCTDPSWLPFEFIDERTGQLDGFDVDLAHLLADRLAPGLRAKFITVGFDSLYDALLSDRCDLVLSALPYEPMRTEDIVFSVSYFNAGLVLVTAGLEGPVEESASIQGEDDGSTTPLRDALFQDPHTAGLVDRVVGVEWGFVPEGDSCRRLVQNLGLRRYATAEETLRALQSGEVEAALVDRISALAYQRDCQGLRIAGKPITDLNYVIPTRPDSFRLLEEVNRVLLEMREDGTLEALQERWF